MSSLSHSSKRRIMCSSKLSFVALFLVFLCLEGAVGTMAEAGSRSALSVGDPQQLGRGNVIVRGNSGTGNRLGSTNTKKKIFGSIIVFPLIVLGGYVLNSRERDKETLLWFNKIPYDIRKWDEWEKMSMTANVGGLDGQIISMATFKDVLMKHLRSEGLTSIHPSTIAMLASLLPPETSVKHNKIVGMLGLFDPAEQPIESDLTNVRCQSPRPLTTARLLAALQGIFERRYQHICSTGHEEIQVVRRCMQGAGALGDTVFDDLVSGHCGDADVATADTYKANATTANNFVNKKGEQEGGLPLAAGTPTISKLEILQDGFRDIAEKYRERATIDPDIASKYRAFRAWMLDEGPFLGTVIDDSKTLEKVLESIWESQLRRNKAGNYDGLDDDLRCHAHFLGLIVGVIAPQKLMHMAPENFYVRPHTFNTPFEGYRYNMMSKVGSFNILEAGEGLYDGALLIFTVLAFATIVYMIIGYAAITAEILCGDYKVDDDLNEMAWVMLGQPEPQKGRDASGVEVVVGFDVEGLNDAVCNHDLVVGEAQVRLVTDADDNRLAWRRPGRDFAQGEFVAFRMERAGGNLTATVGGLLPNHAYEARIELPRPGKSPKYTGVVAFSTPVAER